MYKNLLAPIFSEGRPKLFYGKLLARVTFYRLSNFGCPFADLRLRSLEMKKNAKFANGG